MSINYKESRVVITGLGCVTSIGIGIEKFWKNLVAGKSGISKVTTFDTSNYDRHMAGEIKNFDPTQFLHRRRASMMGRSSQMAIAASKLALKDAGLTKKDIAGTQSGVCVGTTMAESQNIEKMVEGYAHEDHITAKQNLVVMYPANSITTNIADVLKLRNVNMIFANACAAGNYAIGYSYDLIKAGRIDYVLAGGSDALSRIAFTGFNRLFAMAQEKCAPFDKNRKGMMLAEGSGMLVLESLESAQKRRAKIYAEVLGYGLSCDAHHMTNPSADGIGKAMAKAVQNANIKKGDVQFICTHGTGTGENDKAESSAINQVFGKYAKNIYVNSIKSMLGHTMGAASALEAISCCMAIKDGVIPPTINFEESDPECDVNLVANVALETKLDVVLNNASAFGGNNCCLVLKKY